MSPLRDKSDREDIYKKGGEGMLTFKQIINLSKGRMEEEVNNELASDPELEDWLTYSKDMENNK